LAKGTNRMMYSGVERGEICAGMVWG
jgi:hypothetical protein